MQAGEKLLLAEGSKMVMAMGQSAYDQGVYGLVVSLGSLVVRTLFQPIEEAAFVTFAKQGEHAVIVLLSDMPVEDSLLPRRGDQPVVSVTSVSC